jgi:NCS1 family nucleobase:cation symporter-1
MAETLRELESDLATDAGPAGMHDFRVETRGLDPVPDDQRYGDHKRLLSIFFFPNMTPSVFFAGTLATATFIGLNFWWALVAIVVGNLVASVPVGLLGVMGARTGLAQLPLARLPFGRLIAVPALLNWGSTILWDGLNCLFGAEAMTVLLGTPFWAGLVIILIAQLALSVIGYEAIHTFGKWISVIIGLVFVAITVKCITAGTTHITPQLHGGAAVGGFILFLAIIMSYTFTWAPYAADYTHYVPKDTPSFSIVWRMTAGNAVSAIWLETIGLVAASQLLNQTSAGIYNFLGKGAFGAFAMIAIVLSNVGADAMDDYSGALSLQAAGIRIPRPISGVIVAAGGFGMALYLKQGDFQAKLTNFLLFLGYWIAPMVGVVLVDWWLRKGRVDSWSITRLRKLPIGWQALAALVVGFCVSLPFMDSSLYVGAIASGPLKGGDIAYVVGGIVAGLIYFVLAKVTHSVSPAEKSGAGTTSEIPLGPIDAVREATPVTPSVMAAGDIGVALGTDPAGAPAMALGTDPATS